MDGEKPVRIAVVGPYYLVRRVLEYAPMRINGLGPYVLSGHHYENETEAVELVPSLSDAYHGVLFTGPFPYRLANDVGAINLASAYVPLSADSALYSIGLYAIDRGVERDALRCISCDTLARPDVLSGLRGSQVGELGIFAAEDRQIFSPKELVKFHLDARRSGATLALTAFRSVYDRLEALDVDVVHLQPTLYAVREALREVLLSSAVDQPAAGSFAVVGVRTDLERSLSPGDAIHDLQVAVDALDAIAARSDGFVLRGSGDAVWLISYVGRDAAEAGSERPSRADESVVASLEQRDLTYGSGRSSSLATAFSLAREAMTSGRPRSRPESDTTVPSPPRHSVTYEEVRTKLASTCGRSSADSTIVSATDLSEILGLSPRHARRVLDGLVDAGNAWSLPPGKPGVPGRPRREWRVLL